jgi:hypothetical protein
MCECDIFPLLALASNEWTRGLQRMRFESFTHFVFDAFRMLGQR